MKSFEKEQICEANFRAGGPYWHLYTPGNVTTAFLLSEDDCAFAMNTVYFAHQLTAGIRILAFELMSNHLHMLIEGDAESVCRFFASLRKKLARGLASDRVSVLDSFVMQLKKIEDLGGLRNTIGYVHRNGYVAPISYCSIDRGMSMFRDAHHYFSIVGKNVEAYSELGLSQFEVDALFPIGK